MNHRRLIAASAPLLAGSVLLLTAGTAQAASLPIVDLWPNDDFECVYRGPTAPIEIELEGLPESLEPDTWAEFTYRVTNLGDAELENLYTYADFWTYPEGEENDVARFEFQWYTNGHWTTLEFESDLAYGSFGIVRLMQSGMSAEAQVRVRVLDPRPGTAELTTNAFTPTGQDECGWAPERQSYEIALTGAAEQPGEGEDPGAGGDTPGDGGTDQPGDETPAPSPAAPGADGGPTGNAPAPQGGQLAATGPADSLPLLAAAGGAVALGGALAGGVYRLRRTPSA